MVNGGAGTSTLWSEEPSGPTDYFFSMRTMVWPSTPRNEEEPVQSSPGDIGGYGMHGSCVRAEDKLGQGVVAWSCGVPATHAAIFGKPVFLQSDLSLAVERGQVNRLIRCPPLP